MYPPLKTAIRVLEIDSKDDQSSTESLGDGADAKKWGFEKVQP